MAFREKVLGKLAIPKRTSNASAKIDGTINNEQRSVVEIVDAEVIGLQLRRFKIRISSRCEFTTMFFF